MNRRVRRAGAVDVHYTENHGALARAAVVVTADTSLAAIVEERVVDVPVPAPYAPGSFYRRELPALLAVLGGVKTVDLLVVDGFATLDPEGSPGLGARAHDALGVPVIGVAKTRFRTATHAIEVVRGQARRPLYVTAVGLSADEAASIVHAMAGPYRIPDALRRADQLSRSPAPGSLLH